MESRHSTGSWSHEARLVTPLPIHIDGLIYSRQGHGGISRNFTNLINAFAERSDAEVNLYLEPGVVLPDGMSPVRTCEIPGDIHVRPSRLFHGLSASMSDRRRRSFWSSARSGVFHSSYYSSPAGLRIPQVLTMQDTIFEDFPNLFSSSKHHQHVAEKTLALRQSDALIFSSRFARDRTEAIYDVGSRPVLVAPYAIDPGFARVPADGSAQEFSKTIIGGRPFLLHVGSRYLHKNVPRLLQAFSGWDQRTEIALVLAGGGPLQSDEQNLMSSLGVEADVVVVPRMSDDQLLCAYHAATAFVFPSLSEGFGFPILEALACGCPTACSNAASLPEVGGSAPVYFDPMDTDSIRSALGAVTALADDHERWACARDHANRRSWHDVAGEYLSFYHEVLADNRSFATVAGAAES